MNKNKPLWDNRKCSYDKSKQKDSSRPCYCFRPIFHCKIVPVDQIDFVSCEIISDLISEEK